MEKSTFNNVQSRYVSNPPVQTEAVTGKSKDQQVQELQQQNLPYAEYQRRYKEIMDQ